MLLILRLAYFMTLFGALAFLLRWLHLREKGPHRLNRSLRAYVGETGDRLE